jgi:hypothetical protein
MPPFAKEGQNIFPHNISFSTADWTNEEIHTDSRGYDAVIALVFSSIYSLTRNINSCQFLRDEMDPSERG